MIRSITFGDNGEIIIKGEQSFDVVASGVVMLTKEQADKAVRHGWRIEGEPETSTVPPLYRVKR